MDEERASKRLFNFPSIDGSSKFQVMVFKPNCKFVKASPRLCICKKCQTEYGSCELFEEYPLICHQLNKAHLRSDNLPMTTSKDNENDDFILLDSFVAVAADSGSIDTVWFIHIVDKCTSDGTDVDDYGHGIPHGVKYLKGHFLERIHTLTTYQLFTISKKPPISIMKILCILT